MCLKTFWPNRVQFLPENNQNESVLCCERRLEVVMVTGVYGPVPQWAAWRSPRLWGSWTGGSGPRPADPSSAPGGQTSGWELQEHKHLVVSRCQRRLGWCVHFKTQPTFAKRCLLLKSGSHLFNKAGMFCWSRGCLFVFLLHVHPAQSSKTAGGEPAITRSRLHDRLFDNQ